MAENRLSALDASFLHLEDDAAHMHVASVLVFEGDAPPYDELLEHIERRLHLVPRYRQKLAFVPLRPGPPALGRRPAPQPPLPRPLHRAAWPRLRAAVARARGTRLRPAARPRQAALGDLARRGPRGRAEGEALSRCSRRPTTRSSTGSPGVDIVSILFDTSAEPAAPADPGDALASAPGAVQGRSCSARRSSSERPCPAEVARSVRALFRAPRQVAKAAVEAAAGVGAMAWAGLNPAPPSIPYNRRIGPHRRFTWVRDRPSPTSRRSRTSSAAPSTTWCSRRSPAASAATCAAAGRRPRASS